MKYRMIVAALAALATPAAAGDLPRVAQVMEGVPPYEVLSIVRSAGLDPIGRPARRGPSYVLHAIDDDDREVRVVVDARYGDIVSITPVVTASRDLPPRDQRPYERAPDNYSPPGYRSNAPIIYRTDPPMERPRAGLPNDPMYAGRSLPPPGRGLEPPPVIYGDRAPDEPMRQQQSPRPMAPTGPRANIEPGIAPDRDGLLPPPPERFPQRAPPAAAKPVPPKRAAAAPPKPAPLPKPRPAEAAKVDAPPAPQPAAEPPKAAAEQMPN